MPLEFLERQVKEDSLTFFRAKTGSYWTINVKTARFEERFVSPLVETDHGRVVFNDDNLPIDNDAYSPFASWNGEAFALLKYSDDQNKEEPFHCDR